MWANYRKLDFFLQDLIWSFIGKTNHHSKLQVSLIFSLIKTTDSSEKLNKQYTSLMDVSLHCASAKESCVTTSTAWGCQGNKRNQHKSPEPPRAPWIFANAKQKPLLRVFKFNFQLGHSFPWALCMTAYGKKYELIEVKNSVYLRHSSSPTGTCGQCWGLAWNPEFFF